MRVIPLRSLAFRDPTGIRPPFHGVLPSASGIAWNPCRASWDHSLVDMQANPAIMHAFALVCSLKFGVGMEEFSWFTHDLFRNDGTRGLWWLKK